MNLEQLPQMGLGHPSLKGALGLARAADPDGRRLLVEGIWAHEALVETGTAIESFWWCREASWSERARDLAAVVADRSESVYRISPRALSRLVERDRPDGLVSLARPRAWNPGDIVLPEQALVLVADGLESPGNLGTLIRTLDACAADALLVTDRRTSVVHPQVFRASHGASLTVPCLAFEDTAEAVMWLRERDCTVLLADPTDDAVPYRDADWSGRTALVLGNERYGLSPAWRGPGFGAVQIPMLGRGDSLNAAVAASVLLFEARAHKSLPPV